MSSDGSLGMQDKPPIRVILNNLVPYLGSLTEVRTLPDRRMYLEARQLSVRVRDRLVPKGVRGRGKILQ